MNRNLLIFSLFLIFLGFGTGFFLISLFGLLLLIPALLSPAKRPVLTPSQASSKPQARRIAFPVQQPTSQVQPAPAAGQAIAVPVVQMPSTPSFSAPLFPAPILPALSPMTMLPQPQSESAKPPEQRDELLEVGAILYLLKLALG